MSAIDDEIVGIAERRQQLITSGELERLGLSTRSVQRRIGTGRLRRMTRDVFATVPPPDDVARWELALCLSHPAA